MAQLTDIDNNPRGSHGPKSPLPALALTGVGVVEGEKSIHPYLHFSPGRIGRPSHVTSPSDAWAYTAPLLLEGSHQLFHRL